MRSIANPSANAVLSGVLISSVLLCGTAISGTVDPAQTDWFNKYKTQENIPEAETMLLNTDPEPALTDGFTQLFNGTDLSGWKSIGGKSKFEVRDGLLVGTCVAGTPGAYLCSRKSDYTDFIFTCDMKWEVDINSGVMFRAQSKMQNDREIAIGPQAEMEGITGDRFWSGGIYGQGCGGYFYPMWLREHAKARAALNRKGWNRLTIMARGKVVKTWLNGVPAAHWVGDGTHAEGFFGLQIHQAAKGKVLWRKVAVKELAATGR